MAWIIDNLHRHLLSDILFGSSRQSGLPLKQFNSISIKAPIHNSAISRHLTHSNTGTASRPKLYTESAVDDR